MKEYGRLAACLFCGALLAVTPGCSNKPKPVDKARVDAIAQEKVDVIKRMADELAKDPSGRSAAGLVEEFMTTPLDPQQYPAQAAEIIKVYSERVKGKLKGDAASQMQGAINALQPPGGQGK
jgi:hypothetical protein